MTYQGKTIQCLVDQEGIAQLKFNNEVTGANVFNTQALSELQACLEQLKNDPKILGLVMSSPLDNFIFGADITEFLTHFKKSDDEMKNWLTEINKTFNGHEDLPFPTVAAINGHALGGGFEIALACDFRVAATNAKVGLPETKLGIMPGWGGTVRLSRLTGADHAIEWITSGNYYSASDALKVGAIDAVTDSNNLHAGAVTLLKRALAGELDWQAKRTIKKSPLKINKIEATMAFETAKGFVLSVAGPNYPAPVLAIETMAKHATCDRDQALKIETESFVKLAKGAVAESLVSVFLGDQYLKKISKTLTKGLPKTQRAAVLGAGIMGGGIAYQSASKGVPIIMKDINTSALQLGMGEATKLLGKLIERKKIDHSQMAAIIASISPTLSYGDFKSAEIIVEAVVENPKIKSQVLAELENHVSDDTVITSNTSTILISQLASGLKRPELFCGMHFFNPVHRMPLVEVIRGEKTGEAAISKAVQYALQMGKTPIVVNDCPGFLVNRILFPYFNGLIKLINDGVDFVRIDKVMEKFGWPMGPAYLLDVVGIDTAVHASKIMAAGFPDRMKHDGETIIDFMAAAQRYGQKNGKGFYHYTLDSKGKTKKEFNQEVGAVIAKAKKRTLDVTDAEIVERMMLPMIIESARCLEDKIVSTPTEVDMGLLLGLGFPPFRTGALKYADQLGLAAIAELSKKYAFLGKAYEVTEQMKKMGQENKTYYAF